MAADSWFYDRALSWKREACHQRERLQTKGLSSRRQGRGDAGLCFTQACELRRCTALLLAAEGEEHI